MQKYIYSFLKRKCVIEIIGEDFQLTDIQCGRLLRFFHHHGSLKKNEDWMKTIAFMIKHDLTNISGRVKRLKLKPASPDLMAYYLRYGRHAKHYWDIMVFNRTAKFKTRTIYWENQGYSKEESQQKVREIQRERNERAVRVLKGSSLHTCRSVEYWLAKGYDLKEAKEQVRQVQSRNHTTERNQRWQDTLNAKTDEEKKEMNLRKSHSVAGYIARGMDKDVAIETKRKYDDNLREKLSKYKPYSLASQRLFDSMKEILGPEHIRYATHHGEYAVKNRSVDFFDDLSKIVIEFNGDYWHANPDVVKDGFIRFDGKTAQAIWRRDELREAVIRSSRDVNDVVVVWENEFRKNPRETAIRLSKIIIEGRNQQ